MQDKEPNRENSNPEELENPVSNESVNAFESESVANREVNTYDMPPLSNNKSSSDAKGRSSKKPFHILKSLLSISAFVMFFITVIFSASELFEIVVDDMGAGNMLLGRIFGKSAITDDGNNLCDIIINQNFIVLETDSIITETPPESSEMSTNAPESASPPRNEESAPSDEKRIPILPMDMSLLSYGKNFIYNDTSLSPNISELSYKAIKKFAVSNLPLVLVIHTHTTESYMPEGADFYIDDGNELARSTNPEENMIAVGKEFTRILIENGIPTLHCTIIHDKDSYRESYSRAAESIAKYLKEYPSIRYVFDIHRDSLMRSSGELISSITSIEGQNHAQIMAVVGGSNANWESNLIFALRLRGELNDKFTNLCRPVCLRESSYNQHMSEISLILEIGTSGNSLSEALAAARLTAEAISKLIKG